MEVSKVLEENKAQSLKAQKLEERFGILDQDHSSLKKKLSEFYSLINSKLKLPEEAKKMMETDEVPLYMTVKEV